MVLAELVAGRGLGDAAGPLGDGAVGIAGFLGAEWGEVTAEPRDFVGGKLRGGGASQCQRQDCPSDNSKSK